MVTRVWNCWGNIDSQFLRFKIFENISITLIHQIVVAIELYNIAQHY